MTDRVVTMHRVCRSCGNTRKVRALEGEHAGKLVPCPYCADQVALRGPGPPANFQLVTPPRKKYYSQVIVHVVDRRTQHGVKPLRTMCGDFIDDTWELGRSTVKEPWNDATCAHCVDKLRSARDARLSQELTREKEG